MTTVSLKCAQALKAAGFPQDRWPQMVYIYCGICDVPKANVIEWRTGAPFDYQHPQLSDKFLAAPDPLTALEWLRSTGWHIWANLGPPGTGESWEAAKQEWMPLSLTGESHLRADDPDALIIAICQRLTA